MRVQDDLNLRFLSTLEGMFLLDEALYLYVLCKTPCVVN